MERDYSFARYLAAKKSVDDRALNLHVSETLSNVLTGKENLSVLEVGAGIGTMVERLYERQTLLPGTSYLAIDAQVTMIETAQERLRPLAEEYALELEVTDLLNFLAREQGRRTWDLLIAHAFLDLVDLKTTLPQLIALLNPDGLFYFTINFDGETILHPVIDRELDEQIIALYHRTMDTRRVNGRRSGDSRTGRKMFTHLPDAGAEILDAGSSDWVVYSRAAGYEADEAYFLHYIVNTIAHALDGNPDLDRHYFEAWIAQRHAQIEAGNLVYIAHQLDFCGRRAS